MTFLLINYDGNKGENNEDEALLETINHLLHWLDRTQLQK